MESPAPLTLTLREKCRLGSVLLGGILIHLSLGTIYTFGNMNPYITSYMRWKGVSPNLTEIQCSWAFALASIGQGLSMGIGGILEQWVGLRIATLIGGWLMSLGVFLTYISIQHSFAGFIVTYGLMFGLGIGLAYSLPLNCAMRWMPQRKGLMNGLIVAGFGGGAFIFDQVQTAFINPDNVKATPGVGEDKYFTDPDLLDRVPKVFLILGACYSMMQLIGCLLLTKPPFAKREEIENPNGNTSGDYRLLKEEDQILNSQQRHTNPTTAEKEFVPDSTPGQVLRSKHYYNIFFSFFFMGQGLTLVSTLYKAYGFTFISDDTFLTWTGTFSAVFNGLGRIFWGNLSDKYSYKVAALLMTCAFTCLLLTLQISAVAGKAFYFIYVCLLFGCFSGCFALYPTVTAKLFGQKHMPKNYGLVFLSQCLTAPLGVFASHKLQESLGWSGLFYYTAASSFIAFVCAIFFDAKYSSGKEI